MRLSIQVVQATLLAGLFLMATSASGLAINGHYSRAADNSTDAKNIRSCMLLPEKVQGLLLDGKTPHGRRYNTTDLFSVFYPSGENPTSAQLFADIPTTAFGPLDDVDAAITASSGWDRPQVMADLGYGEQDEVQTVTGGLPSFCRFGGSIYSTKNSSSKVFFEVWLPLPNSGGATAEIIRSNSTQAQRFILKHHPSGSSNFFSNGRSGEEDPAQISMLRGTQFSDLLGDGDGGGDPSRNVSTTTAADGGGLQRRPFIPASRRGWRGRLLFMVGGGTRGTVTYPELKQAMCRYRVAVAGTNMGHFSSGGQTSWLVSNPEGWTDFGHRAVHISTIVTQLSIKTFYGVKDVSGWDADGNQKRTSADVDAQVALLDRGQVGGNEEVDNDYFEDEGEDEEEDWEEDHHWDDDVQINRPGLGFMSYFKGCSTGGRAGMAEAQRYPSDYDGIMAGAPAFDYNNMNAYQIHVNSLQANKSSPSYIPLNDYALIHRTVLDQCDGKDGVKDGVITDPTSCRPDFGVLLCREDDASQVGAPCLTRPQLDNLNKIYEPLIINASLVHEPVLPGSEWGWTVTDGVVGTPFPASVGWFQDQVLKATAEDPNFDPYTQVTPEVIALGQREDPGGTINFNTDLTPYFKMNRKLLHYHGWADQLIPPGQSVRYWEQVNAKVQGSEWHKSAQQGKSKRGGGDDDGQASTSAAAATSTSRVQDFYRLFMVPGMIHCRSGDGPFNFGGASQIDQSGWRPLEYDPHHDALLALIDWVEHERSPDFVVGASYKRSASDVAKDGAVTTPKDDRRFSYGVENTRKLCPYPLVATLDPAVKGAPGQSLSSSFHCARVPASPPPAAPAA
ncbi:tannase-domain-containing protein [Violaceomyces palustris]|uniref:Tannase-domain-containing protein n=1 Tax=Violaceomyces palustris TaxID=1673888 RepID=A0ACD0NXR9_9BASI|nr:tannase-domain-containing protein [Violaceomyces palustris]